jgi:hypothetical protein
MTWEEELRVVLKKALALLDFHYDQRLHGTVEIPATALSISPEPIAVTASFAPALDALEIIGRKMDEFSAELDAIRLEQIKTKDPDLMREREVACRCALGALAMVRDEIRGRE